MKPKWKTVINAALGVVGLEKFELKDGKINLSDEQKAKVEELGPGLTQAIENHLKTETPNAEDEIPTETFDAIVAANTKEIVDGLKAQLSEKDKTINAQKKIIETLAKEPEDDVTPKGGPDAQAPTFKPNMNLFHNRMWAAAQNPSSVLPVAEDSVDIADLKTEFGLYIKGEKRNIFRKLLTKTETMQYMTTIQTDDSVWRASYARMSHVVQQFVSAFTPLGKATFTPLTIPMRRHKINTTVTPADVIGSWLGFMYDESKTPKDMPLIAYILDMIIEQAIEDRELLQVMTGEFEEITVKPATGTTGQDTDKSVDGLLTILRKEYEDADSTVHFVNLGVITESNVVDKMKAFRKSLPKELRRKPMDLLLSDDLRGMYKDAYQTLFPNTKNEDASKETLDHSLIRLAPVASLSGLNSFFVTPKDNLILLRSKNEVAASFRLETQDYDVKIFSEWSESYGFAIKEAILAYIDPIWVVDGYAKKDDASKLLIKMLTDAGCENVNSAKLAGYKTAIAAASGIADLEALQAIVTAVNAA